MYREIFGPILPIVEVEDVHEAIQTVADRFVFSHYVFRFACLSQCHDRPFPLVVYTFTNSNDVKEESASCAK